MVKKKGILLLAICGCLAFACSAEARHHHRCSSFGVNVGLQAAPCYGPVYAYPVPACYPQRTVIVQDSYCRGYNCNSVYVAPASPCFASPVTACQDYYAPSSASISFSWFNSWCR